MHVTPTLSSISLLASSTILAAANYNCQCGSKSIDLTEFARRIYTTNVPDMRKNPQVSAYKPYFEGDNALFETAKKDCGAYLGRDDSARFCLVARAASNAESGSRCECGGRAIKFDYVMAAMDKIANGGSDDDINIVGIVQSIEKDSHKDNSNQIVADEFQTYCRSFNPLGYIYCTALAISSYV